MKFIDLFAGVGGFRLGLERAGHECVYTNEFDKYAVKTYKKNFGGKVDARDIRTVKAGELPEFDLLCGGFPCQTFSIAGKRGGFEDTRGTLFFEIARILKVKRPSFVLLENVKGLLNHDEGKTFSVIISTLGELGYECEWMVFNSKFFGVPQNRERVFIIGSLRGERRREVLFKRENAKQVSRLLKYQTEDSKPEIGQAKRRYGVNGIIPPLQNWSPLIFTQERKDFRKHSTESEVPTLNTVQEPMITYPTLSTELAHGTGRDYLRSGGHKMLKACGKLRRLTPVECERLQGFPDNWTSGVSDTQRYKQMGNAVTVNVIEFLGNNL